MVVPKPKVSTHEASERTKQRRITEIEGVREVVSGGPEQAVRMQQVAEIKRLNKVERQLLVKEAGLKVNIPEGGGLAMKASLAIPWNKFRKMRRYRKLNDYTIEGVGGEPPNNMHERGSHHCSLL